MHLRSTALPVLSEADARAAVAPVAPNCEQTERRGAREPRRSSPRKEASEMTVVRLDARRDAQALTDHATRAIKACEAAVDGLNAILLADDLDKCHRLAVAARYTVELELSR